jgi:hypothetical protein
MSELLDFATRVIELEGGAVDTTPDGLVALLPAALSAHWQTAEELALTEHDGGAGQRLAYGSELLERMLDSATAIVPVAAAQIDLPAPRANQIKSAAERWSLRNGVVSVGDVRLRPALRLELLALATLHGDEKRELCVSTVIAVDSGTEVPGFAKGVVGAALSERASPIDLPEALLAPALSACELRAVAEAQTFRDSMTRRFERDRARIEAYFEDLLGELDKRARRGKLEPQMVADKQQALRADRSAKLEALTARFVLRIEVRPVALRVSEVPGGFASVILRRRKATRILELEYDAATRKLIAPRCDGCARAAPKPAVCDDALHLLCESCAPRAEGRIACSACRPRARARNDPGSTRPALGPASP